jgi:hypothetical protein
MDIRIIASKIVKVIETDFTDRRGLRQQWEQIDAETRQDIRETWMKIVVDILEQVERKRNEAETPMFDV